MGFGDKGAKTFSGNNKAKFDEAASSILADFTPEPSQAKEQEKQTKNEIIVENKKTVESKVNKSEPKKKDSTTGKRRGRKPNSETKLEEYNIRVGFPKEMEPILKLAGKSHGTIREYIMELVYNDLEAHAEEYKQNERKDDNNRWKKFF